MEVCATLEAEKRLAEGGEDASVGRLVVSARSAEHGLERQAQTRAIGRIFGRSVAVTETLEDDATRMVNTRSGIIFVGPDNGE